MLLTLGSVAFSDNEQRVGINSCNCWIVHPPVGKEQRNAELCGQSIPGH